MFQQAVANILGCYYTQQRYRHLHEYMNTLGANDNTVRDCVDTRHHKEPLDIKGGESVHQLVGTESSVLT